MNKLLKKAVSAMILVLMLMSGACAVAQTETANPTQVTEQAPAKKFKGTAKIKLVNKGTLYYGDKVTLKAVVKVNKDYALQWQVKEEGQWKDMAGETGNTFSFVVTPENQDTQYRVMVSAA